MTGDFFIVASPSGGGKTSLVKQLLSQVEHLRLSISYTTRLPRPGEVHGQDYFFVSDDEFRALVEQDKFLEYAEVFGANYGTPRTWVLEQRANNIDVILEVDWQGAMAIKKLIPESVSIFILPPSREAISQRLHHRGQDSEEVIASRMKQMTEQVSHFHEFDYIIVNEAFDSAYEQLKSIVMVRRLTLARQLDKFKSLIDGLLHSSS